jgi:NADH-quinone oxidoreductase subunit J
MGILLFAILAMVAIGASVAMIVHRNPVYSALFMVVTFAATAVMFLVLSAPFIAALQIIVYAGAIVVLFLFVIMFLSLKSGVLFERQRGPLVLALVLAAVIAGQLAAVVATGTYAGEGGTPVPAGFGSVESVATLLFTRYLVPFEITSILLVVGMVGAVVLSRRESAAPGRAYDLPGVGGGDGTGEEPRGEAAAELPAPGLADGLPGGATAAAERQAPPAGARTSAEDGQ